MSGNITLANRDLFRMYMALKTLGSRRMATVNADLKVGRLLRVLAPLVEPLDELKQRVVKEVLEGAPKDTTGVATSLLNIRVAEAQYAIDSDVVDADLPLQFALKEADLPQRKKDADADDPNATGLGVIVADLGPLFLLPEG
jgi:hypothetical protein